MAERLKAPIAIIDKRRPRPNVAEVMNAGLMKPWDQLLQEEKILPDAMRRFAQED